MFWLGFFVGAFVTIIALTLWSACAINNDKN